MLSKMLLAKMLLTAVAIVSLCAGPALADADGVIGRMNLQTGTFTPFAPAPDAASKTYAGTIQVTLNIQIKSALPAKQSYTCGVQISVYNTGGGGKCHRRHCPSCLR